MSSQIQSRVTVITKLTAVSSNPSASGRVYPLSAADHAMGRHSAAVVMYYGENPFGSFIVDPMRESLSKVLTLYPTVTGRLTRSENGNWAVKGNDAGVRVTMTKVGTTLDEWLRSADSAEERDLAALEEMPDCRSNLRDVPFKSMGRRSPWRTRFTAALHPPVGRRRRRNPKHSHKINQLLCQQVQSYSLLSYQNGLNYIQILQLNNEAMPIRNKSQLS